MKEAIRTSLHVHMGQECGVLLGRGRTLLSEGRGSSEGCPEGAGKERSLAGTQAELGERSASRGAHPAIVNGTWSPKRGYSSTFV